MTQKVERPSPLTGLAQAWILVATLLFFAVKELSKGDLSWQDLRDLITGDKIGFTLLFLAGVAVLTILWGVVHWRTTAFVVAEEFRIEKRFLWVSIVRIDFTKIQAVDIVRPLGARFFGLSALKIDVGGSDSQELRFLRNSRAEQLRDYLLEQMAAGSQPHADIPLQQHSQGAVAYRINQKNVILGAFLSFGISGIVFVLVLAAITIPWGIGKVFYLWFAALAALWRIPSALITNWDFTIWRSDIGLRIQRGMFSKTQTTLRPDRIQVLSIEQNALMRLAKIVTVRISILGNKTGQDDSKGINVLLPFGSYDEAIYTIGLIWPELNIAALTWQPQTPRGRWASGFIRYWNCISDQVVGHRSALLSHNLILVPHARVQGLAISQGPLQRRLSLASVDIQVIEGAPDLELKHFPIDQARAVFQQELALSTTARLGRTKFTAKDLNTVDNTAPATGKV